MVKRLAVTKGRNKFDLDHLSVCGGLQPEKSIRFSTDLCPAGPVAIHVWPTTCTLDTRLLGTPRFIKSTLITLLFVSLFLLNCSDLHLLQLRTTLCRTFKKSRIKILRLSCSF